MFNNIGGKIKIYAFVIFLIGLLVSVVKACSMFALAIDMEYNSPLIIEGFKWFLGGPLISWLAYALLAGYGQLIESSETTTALMQQLVNTVSYIEENLDSHPVSEIPDAPSSPSTNNEPSRNKHYVFDQWRCPYCNTFISEYPCPHCGNKQSDSSSR